MAWGFWLATTARAMPTVEAALRKRNWKYTRISAHMILTGVQSIGGKYLIVLANDTEKKTLMVSFNELLIDQDLDNFVRTGQLPVLRVHQSLGHTTTEVAAVCERLLGENYRIAVGRFEREPKDGEIRFVIALPYRDRPLSVDQVDWSITVGIHTLDLILPQVHGLVAR
jgi:hypothetical protein